MSKFAHDDVLDALVDYIADNCKLLTVCTTQPTNYTEASATNKLADVVMTEGVGNGDFTKGNGDTNGRKLTVAQQATIPIDTSGSAQHVALGDTDNSKLLFVTTCTTQSLTAGGTVTVPAFDIEVADPS